MREILRLVDACQKPNSHVSALRGYNLEVYAGDIVVVSGMAGSGLRGLLSFLDGSDGLKSGAVYIDEQPVALRRDRSPLWNKIFIFSDALRQFGNLSIAENLSLLSMQHNALRLFHENEVNERARRHLQEEGIQVLPSAKVDSLSWWDRQRLTLLLAKMAHASLIVIDCTEAMYGDEMMNALFSMIRKYQREGMAFLLVSYREDVYKGLANRFQRIAYGKDVMEYDGQKLRCVVQDSFSQNPLKRCNHRIEGIWDEAMNGMNMCEYLGRVCSKNARFFETRWNVSLPKQPKYAADGVVLIPKDSAQLLVENLSIEDNVILTIPNRIRKGLLGYISPRMMHAAVKEFYRVSEINEEKKSIAELSLVERKILSLYRWEQAKPRLMILEIPNFGMDRVDSLRLERYLLHLAEKGMQLLILSDSQEQMRRICSRITAMKYGEKMYVCDAVQTDV